MHVMYMYHFNATCISDVMLLLYIRPSKPVPLVLDSEGKAELPIAVRAPTLMVRVMLLYSGTSL